MVGNLDKDTVRWLIDMLVGTLAFVGGFWLTNLTQRIDDIAKDLAERNQKIAALETHIEVVNRRLDRIEGKIDYLVERTQKR